MIGFFPAMFLVFLTLKLTNVIDWSWWWVTAPLWGSFLVGLVAILTVAFVESETPEERAIRRLKERYRRDR